MTLYVIPRRRAWLSDEQLAASAGCVPAVNATMEGEVRWIRSYVVREEDGAYTGYCVYEAASEDALRRHAEALKLPADAIQPVHATLVARPDPAPVVAV